MDDDQDAPVYPLIGFTAGVIDGAVALRLEFATSRDQYSTGDGETQTFVMSRAAAIEISEALEECGAVAQASPH